MGKSPTFAGDAVGGASVENHPLEERVVVHILLGPRGAQAAGAAALLLAQLRLVQHLAAAVLGLAEPAVPGCEETGWEGGRMGARGVCQGVGRKSREDARRRKSENKWQGLDWTDEDKKGREAAY